ncbi:MAG: hypothetical protein E7510_06025 [Ruminococcus sp.]|nr:hypothetical protein [Ruminococcus sp.]
MNRIKNKNINLYERLKQSEEKGKSKKKSMKFKIIVFGASVLGVAVAGFLGVTLYANSVQEKYDEINAMVNDPVLVLTIEEDNIFLSNNAALEQIKVKYDETTALMQKSNKIKENLTPGLINDILSCQTADVRVYQISFDGNNMNISCITTFADSSAQFVSALERRNIFGNIEYNGFAGQGDQYTFNVIAPFLEKEEVISDGQ